MIALPKRVLRLLAAGLLLCSGDVCAQQDAAADGGTDRDPTVQAYRLGQGLRLGDSGFVLGGYGTIGAGQGSSDRQGTVGGDAWRAGLDSLSGFLGWDGGERWHFFSELELEDALVAKSGELTTKAADVELERFYLDYAQNDLLKLRLGKFLTPVGRWNLIHASPLVWTTSRPLITERTFPTNATGAMVYGLLPCTVNGIEYSIYYSPGTELARDPDLDTFDEALGGHLSFTLLPYTQLGLSYVNFEQRYSKGEHKNLYGADFIWARRRWELSGEFHYRSSDGDEYKRDESGFYLQAVAPLTERLYAVARYENFRRSDADHHLNIYLGGLNFRLRSAVVLKAEYSHATDTGFEPEADTGAKVRDGFLASLAVLF